MQIVYVTADTFFDNVIRLFDGGQFSHCACVFDDKVVQALPSGVTETPLNQLLAACTVTKMIDVPLPDEAAAKAWAYARIGEPYDFLAVAMLALRSVFKTSPHWDANGHLFCDELVLEACAAGGLASPPKYPRFYGIQSSLNYLLQFAKATS